MPSANKPKVTTSHIAGVALCEAAAGAALGGISGLFGKLGLSIFNPTLASAAGSFLTFATVGAIAAPLVILPTILSDCLIENMAFLEKRPNAKEFIKDTSKLLLQIAAIAAAAAILSTPIGPTVICMMVIPVIYYVLKSICNLVNALNENEIPVASNTYSYN